MTDFLKALNESKMQPNVASRHLAKHFDSVLKPLGLHYETHRSTEGRVVGLWRINDDNDGIDDSKGNDTESSIDKETAAYRARFMAMMAGNDGQLSLPKISSLSSISSIPSPEQPSEGWKPIDENEEKSPFPA